jgi:hypothetical protein
MWDLTFFNGGILCAFNIVSLEDDEEVLNFLFPDLVWDIHDVPECIFKGLNKDY